MTKEEIRQKAIECGNAFTKMCWSKEFELGDELKTTCSCEYNEVADVTDCAAVYAYEHGFADGYLEGGKRMSDIDIRNVITSLEEIKRGFGTLDEYIEQMKGVQT